MPLPPTVSKKKRGLTSLLESMPESKNGLNFQSSNELLTSILYPACSVEQFLAEYWEKQPLYISGASMVRFSTGAHPHFLKGGA